VFIFRVFRLGKMIGVKGPGRVLIFPWMDRTKCIDVRAAAFAVPPQQFITCDGGIVEMGAEIQVTLLRAILNFTPGPKG
jgi:regulator of protease activity HflC (stomatin/prohibitin superfamily)